ncbi:MAG: hypothetical protein ACREFL_15430 [Stellaceae bacterium]
MSDRQAPHRRRVRARACGKLARVPFFIAILGGAATLAPAAALAGSLASGAQVTLQQNGAPNSFIVAGGSSVTVNGSSPSDTAVFGFADLTRPSSPYNNDLVTLKDSAGAYLAVAAGGVVATSSTPANFKIRKVSGTSGLGIADGDVVYLVSPDGHDCGPNSSRQFVCMATWPSNSLFFRIALSSAGGTTSGTTGNTTGVQAARAQQLLNGFGVNTHIDAQKYGYQNLTQLIANINYLGNGGLKTLRDSPASPNDLTWWPQVASATGAKFDAFIGFGPVSVYSAQLSRMTQMLQSGGHYLMGLEGGNEEDDPYPVSLGNNQYQAASVQPQVYSLAQSYGVPAFNISFGAGWSNPIGDYGTVGDLSAYAAFANAHTYPSTSPNAHNFMANLNADAKLAASSRLVAITEYGWITYPDGSPAAGYGRVSRATQAAYVAEGIFDAWRLGNPYYFYYALYDDNSGAHGLFDDFGNAKPAAVALHNLFALLADGGAQALSFAPGKLDYALSGMPAPTTGVSGSGGQQVLLQKSDGSFWLALWNEQILNNTATGADISVAPVAVTLTLGAVARSIAVLDPLIGIGAVKSASSASLLGISLPAHPILVKVVP